MSSLKELDKLLKRQSLESEKADWQSLLNYAEYVAEIENVVAVVSDLRNDLSRIYCGKLGAVLGIESYRYENSIWEKTILNLMAESEREEKYLAELRYLNFIRHTPRNLRSDFYMASKLRMRTVKGEVVNILHRMYYIYSPDCDAVCYALCLYGSLAFDFAGKSFAVNSITGVAEELTPAKDTLILSKREQQVLKLVDGGKTSGDIAGLLSISRHTVSRHRQEILAKLQVKNSVEACRIAKTLGII